MIFLEEVKKVKVKRYIHPTRILVLGFLLVIFTGAFLLNLPFASQDGNSVGIVNALFTATSAVCVTGLVVVDTATHWTIFGQVVIILLIQIGGLGFMTFATLFAIMIRKHIGYKERMVIQESLNQYKIQGVVKLTKYIFFSTMVIELVGAMVFATVFIPEFGLLKGIGYSLFHSISAFCNAGFDLMGETAKFSSLTSYVANPIVNINAMILVVLGGLGFIVVFDVLRNKKFKNLMVYTKFVLSMTLILITIGSLFIFVFEYTNPNTIGNFSLGNKILASLFHGITPRTAGFNTLALDQMNDSSVLLTMMLMFIGGSSGSTAGGIKITTFGIALMMIISSIKGKATTNIYGRRVSQEIISKSITIIGLGLGLVMFTTMVLTLTEEQEFMAILFEAISAFATVGLSLGITPELSYFGKIMIAITMFFGRVGPLTVFLAIAYKRENKKESVKYPEGKFIVG